MFCSMHNMVVSCVAVGCTNYYGKRNASFYRFPADLELREKWIAAINRADVHDNKKKWRPTPYCRLCSEHFVGGRISHDPRSPAYIPTIFSDVTSPKRKRHFVNKCEVNCDQNKKCTTKVEPFQPEKVIMISESGDAIEEFSSFPNYSSTEVPMKQEANANSDEGNEIDEQPVINNDTLSSDETVAVPSFQIKDETMEIITKCEEDYLSSAEDYGNCYSTVDQGGAENLGNDDNSKEINGSEKVDIEMKDVDDMSAYSMKNNSFDESMREVYSCRFCLFKTIYLYKLRDHFRYHEGEKIFACQLCCFQDDRKARFLAHAKSHTVEKPFSCFVCGYKTNKQKNLNIHLSKYARDIACSKCSYKTDNCKALATHILEHDKERLSCTVCSFTTVHEATLKRHILIHEEKRSIIDNSRYSCEACSYKGSRKADLKRHSSAMHKQKKTFLRALCPFKTANEADKKAHGAVHVAANSLSCGLCPYKASDIRNLHRHQLIHPERIFVPSAVRLSVEVASHENYLTDVKEECPFKTEEDSGNEAMCVKKELSDIEVGKFGCKLCSYRTKNRSNLTKHATTVHEKVVCKLCSYKANNERALMMHLSAHNEKLLVCNVCEFKAKDKVSLNNHSRIHKHGSVFACKLCSFSTKRKSSLRHHNLTVHPEEGYCCKYCSFRSTKYSLHKRCPIHSETKVYSCEYCTYKSTQKAYLARHLKVHSNEKQFSCEICPFKTKDKATLNGHVLAHTGGQPFSCDLCRFRTSKISNLRYHKLIHTGEKNFLCDACPYQSIRLSSLKLHLLTHTGEKPHSCEMCSFKTALLSSLKRHMKTHRVIDLLQ